MADVRSLGGDDATEREARGDVDSTGDTDEGDEGLRVAARRFELVTDGVDRRLEENKAFRGPESETSRNVACAMRKEDVPATPMKSSTERAQC